MKYIVILGDGMADFKIEKLSNKTPLEYAKTGTMDYLSRHGKLGLVKTVPENMPAGSDVANLTVFGYNTQKCYSGRSPLEAVNIGIKLEENDVAFRCNLVTLTEDEPYSQKIIKDHSSDEISTKEADNLIKLINKEFKNENIEFFTGTSYRHIMLVKNMDYTCDLTAPHDILDRKIEEYLPKGFILDLMERSYNLLENTEINRLRKEKNLNPANSAWIWGRGTKPKLESFTEKYKLTGSVISAVDLINGIGRCAGLNIRHVENVTGNIHTNFEGKAKAAVEELKTKDFVYVHIEAPDECGHRNELENKIKAIEFIDNKIVKYIIDNMKGEDFRILILPDHPTPLELRTHTKDPVPFLIYDSTNDTGTGLDYSEENARKTGLFIHEGHTLMDFFINR